MRWRNHSSSAIFLSYGMGVVAKRLWVKNGINRGWEQVNSHESEIHTCRYQKNEAGHADWHVPLDVITLLLVISCCRYISSMPRWSDRVRGISDSRILQ